ncbi:uncharacterized protein K452DRAFT_141435 [Aplosporella prunicola CBS 121167]|uniref:Uncharacterized protein n=1 Tax=Aplosporella prunicola CBS 121167 TaxID=1176127 RepID=A0A6A6BNJ8_9PEZI|nr:uncharacterized protein K452DRAFT_141435 [Aplosporella prunicola CBS 121167]KAF2144407.1 hypothetical protein K452DRAFT_141435 [Aplosporella prunicola CBS 121167]
MRRPSSGLAGLLVAAFQPPLTSDRLPASPSTVRLTRTTWPSCRVSRPEVAAGQSAICRQPKDMAAQASGGTIRLERVWAPELRKHSSRLGSGRSCWS